MPKQGGLSSFNEIQVEITYIPLLEFSVGSFPAAVAVHNWSMSPSMFSLEFVSPVCTS